VYGIPNTQLLPSPLSTGGSHVTGWKTALITGSSRGIGRGIALKLAQGSARIAINYVANKTAAQDTLAQVRAAGADSFIIQADVSQPDDIRHLFNTVQAEFGTLDIFVSNARPRREWFADEAIYEQRKRIPLFLFLAARKP